MGLCIPQCCDTQVNNLSLKVHIHTHSKVINLQVQHYKKSCAQTFWRAVLCENSCDMSEVIDKNLHKSTVVEVEGKIMLEPFYKAYTLETNWWSPIFSHICSFFMPFLLVCVNYSDYNETKYYEMVLRNELVTTVTWWNRILRYGIAHAVM